MDFEHSKVIVMEDFPVKTPRKASDSGDALRAGMVGSMFPLFLMKSTGPAGNKEFEFCKNRTGQLRGKGEGSFPEPLLKSFSSGDQKLDRLLCRAKLCQCLHVGNVLFDGLGAD